GALTGTGAVAGGGRFFPRNHSHHGLSAMASPTLGVRVRAALLLEGGGLQSASSPVSSHGGGTGGGHSGCPWWDDEEEDGLDGFPASQQPTLTPVGALFQAATDARCRRAALCLAGCVGMQAAWVRSASTGALLSVMPELLAQEGE
ncbi:unnamed protein product, partial [Discosporangium mesarthrocarpum]